MRMVKRFLGVILFFAVLGWAGYLWLADRYVVPVMMYHHVRDVETVRADTVSPERLKNHMAFLREHGYHVIDLDELVSGISAGHRFPFKTVAVTFDDGYQDNHQQALAILKKYQIPAAFFVSPSKFGQVAEFKYMDWPQIRDLSRAGMTIACHGMDQVYLPDASDAEQDREIVGCKRALEAGLGESVNFYAYPVGGFNAAVKAKIASAGYRAAFTTNRGIDRFNLDLFELNRIRFSDRDNTSVILWAKLTGFYNLFRDMKAAY